jgi:hypothetical protein
VRLEARFGALRVHRARRAEGQPLIRRHGRGYSRRRAENGRRISVRPRMGHPRKGVFSPFPGLAGRKDAS